jgi:hypothetical protein
MLGKCRSLGLCNLQYMAKIVGKYKIAENIITVGKPYTTFDLFT